MRIDVDLVRTRLSGHRHRSTALERGETFAAVAIILRDRPDSAEVLLIRRSEVPGDPWSGHMAFPGGREAGSDVDLISTAIRETHEEVGLRLNRNEHFIGRLDDLPAVAGGRRAGLVIAPFVFAIQGEPVLVPNVREVEETVWASLDRLASGASDATFSYTFERRTLALPAYDVDGRLVWGLTHRMLGALFEALDLGDTEESRVRA